MKIGSIECQRGERAFGYLEVDRTASEIPVNIPITILCGPTEGPVLVVDAAIHGNENVGCVGIGQFLRNIDVSKIRGTVIGWSSLPSAPDSCATHVVLGLCEGKLVPFSEPFCEDIVSEEASPPDRTWKLSKDPDTGFEIFEIRRSYGFFHIIIPIRVDFVMAKLFPARWCRRMFGPACLAEHCEFSVEVERTAAKEDTFVRLFPSADDTRTPQHVVVKTYSRVEFLTALAPNALDRSGKWKDRQSGEIPWLKVRIDGKEGWVHAEEDLNALGVFQAG